MSKLYNLAKMTTATTGTGTITLGSAVSGFLTFDLAGVANADVVSYGISDGANSEVGYGTYTTSDTTLTRVVVNSTSTDGAIDLTGNAIVYITAITDNIPQDGWTPAQETWTYASADDPTYTFTISGDKTAKYSAGMKIKLTQSTGGTKYAFITAVAYGAPNTTITAYFGTDYNLENEAITAPYWSMWKAPYGFPLDPDKWTFSFTDTTQRTQSTPTASTWYNLGSLSLNIPIGCWKLYYKILSYILANGDFSTAATCPIYITLSTANNSASDAQLVSKFFISAVNRLNCMLVVEKTLTLASKTTYYINGMTDASSINLIGIRNDQMTLVVRATCAYL